MFFSLDIFDEAQEGSTKVQGLMLRTGEIYRHFAKLMIARFGNSNLGQLGYGKSRADKR